jgi:hypothetical protein
MCLRQGIEVLTSSMSGVEMCLSAILAANAIKSVVLYMQVEVPLRVIGFGGEPHDAVDIAGRHDWPYVSAWQTMTRTYR